MPASCWDRVVARYQDLWVPRLIPYHEDLVRKSAPRPGERVLVTAVGPGAELLPVSRAMAEQGVLAATDPSEAMIEAARVGVRDAEIGMPVDLRVADAQETLGGKWDLVLSAFGLWHMRERIGALRAWHDALLDGGRVGVLVWGPPDPEGPFELVGAALHDVDTELAEETKLRELAAREPLGELLEAAGLRMVRHAVVRHTMVFGSAEGFLQALWSGSGFIRVCDELGGERLERLSESFYAKLDPPGPRTPLSFAPAAAIAIGEKV
jgi:O-methyltransferase/aklanonic acid methyltransferase